MFVYKKNPEYGEIRSNFDQKLWGQFYRYEFSCFSDYNASYRLFWVWDVFFGAYGGMEESMTISCSD